MNLKGRDFSKLLDYSSDEIRYLLDLSKKLKKMKQDGQNHEYLKGKNIVILFEIDSTRTRCSFEVAAYDLGMHVTYLGPTGSQMGKKETIKDTARVLTRIYDGIEYRGFSQKTVEELCKYATVPSWNGLTDMFHPTQMLADVMTIEEHFGYLKGINFCFFGDGRNNVGNSLMVICSKLGINFNCCAPKHLWPEEKLTEICKKIARENNCTINFTDNPEEIKNMDVIYTDVWLSMGEDASKWKERIDLLLPYQVNKKVMNSCNSNAIFLHCLPSFHNTDTIIGKQIYDTYGIKEMEVTDEVFESSASKVFEEAENRMHTIKAVMYATMMSENE